MAQHKVIHLINQFMEDHGQSSGKDRVMLWLEDMYSKVRRLPWSWNFKVTEKTFNTLSFGPPVTSMGGATISGAVPNNYVTMTAAAGGEAVSGQRYLTGRYIYVNEEWYRITRINPEKTTGTTSKLYLDRLLSSAVSEQPALLYRRDSVFRTNGIKSISVDDQKLQPLTDEQIYRFKRGLDPRWYYGSTGDPLAYHIDNFKMPHPKYEPVATIVSGTGPSSTLATAGDHRIFFTYVDYETGRESQPGPDIVITVPADSHVTVTYGSPDGKHSHETTYAIKMYVSKKISNYTRTPMYSKGINVWSTTWDKLDITDTSDGHLTYEHPDSTFVKAVDESHPHEVSNEGAAASSYYDGPTTRVVLYPAPSHSGDEKTYNTETIRCLHIDSWSGLPEEKDYIELGRQRELVELFHLYFLMKQSIQNKDPAQFRQMQGAFREQLNFLLAQDGDDQRLDPSSWEYRFFSPTVNAITEEFTTSLKYPF